MPGCSRGRAGTAARASAPWVGSRDGRSDPEPALFDWLSSEVAGNPVTYAVVFAAAATDVLLPIVPSEAIVLTAAVIAANGELLIYLIIPAAAIGAFLGDNVAYWLGRRVGDPVTERLFRGEKARSRLEWAQRTIRQRGGSLIVIGRFIPGGRTATTIAAGTLDLDYRSRFLPADALASVVWAIYISMLGYIGGEAFEDNLLLPLGIAFGIAILVSIAVEVIRRRSASRPSSPRGRRSSRPPGE